VQCLSGDFLDSSLKIAFESIASSLAKSANSLARSH
jgi:hypothetical protein